MYALPGILGLIVFTYIRPQEFVEGMAAIPWINMWLALMLGGFVLDWTGGRLSKEKTPILWWAVAFYFWCFFTLALRAPGELGGRFTFLTTGIGLSLLIQHAVQTFKAFLRVVVVMFCTSMFCVTVAFHQGFQDFQCLIVTF